MSAAKHSSPPWSIKRWVARDRDGAIDACGFEVIDAQGHRISASTLEDDSTEDLFLIAAAPELLQALKDLDEAFCSISEFSTREERHASRLALIAARAAIAKATGEAA